MKKTLILITLSVIALIFAVCSIGAFVNNNLGFGRFVIQFGIAILVEWLCLKNIDM